MAHPVYPCIWFNNQAEQAANFYCSIFKDSKILNSNTLVTNFKINGSQIMALNADHNSNLMRHFLW